MQNMIDGKQLKLLVEMAWQVSCTCDLPGVDEMLKRRNEAGDHEVCGIRWMVFNKLMENIIPKYHSTSTSTSVDMKVEETKEPWQE